MSLGHNSSDLRLILGKRHIRSILKYVGSKFILSQTIRSLTKVTKKDISNYHIKNVNYENIYFICIQ
jgi:hypothetical protein